MSDVCLVCLGLVCRCVFPVPRLPSLFPCTPALHPESAQLPAIKPPPLPDKNQELDIKDGALWVRSMGAALVFYDHAPSNERCTHDAIQRHDFSFISPSLTRTLHQQPDPTGSFAIHSLPMCHTSSLDTSHFCPPALPVC